MIAWPVLPITPVGRPDNVSVQITGQIIVTNLIGIGLYSGRRKLRQRVEQGES